MVNKFSYVFIYVYGVIALDQSIDSYNFLSSFSSWYTYLFSSELITCTDAQHAGKKNLCNICTESEKD